MMQTDGRKMRANTVDGRMGDNNKRQRRGFTI